MTSKSSRSMTYVVQPYGREGKSLRPGNGARYNTEQEAVRKAELIAPRSAGVVVLEVEVAADVDFFGEPRVVATFGQCPEIML